VSDSPGPGRAPNRAAASAKPGAAGTKPGAAGTTPKRPYHVGVAVGLTTGIYAASLLVTTRLQIDADRAVIQDRSPVEAAISALGDHHDWMDARMDDARAQYAMGATGYDQLQERLAKLDQRLARLDTVLGSVEQLSASIRTGLNLPTARTTSTGSSGRPVTGGSTGGTGGGTSKAPKPPAPPPPPPTGGSTGASGAP
jgi:hypothetical protein